MTVKAFQSSPAILPGIPAGAGKSDGEAPALSIRVRACAADAVAAAPGYASPPEVVDAAPPRHLPASSLQDQIVRGIRDTLDRARALKGQEQDACIAAVKALVVKAGAHERAAVACTLVVRRLDAGLFDACDPDGFASLLEAFPLEQQEAICTQLRKGGRPPHLLAIAATQVALHRSELVNDRRHPLGDPAGYAELLVAVADSVNDERSILASKSLEAIGTLGARVAQLLRANMFAVEKLDQHQFQRLDQALRSLVDPETRGDMRLTRGKAAQLRKLAAEAGFRADDKGRTWHPFKLIADASEHRREAIAQRKIAQASRSGANAALAAADASEIMRARCIAQAGDAGALAIKVDAVADVHAKLGKSRLWAALDKQFPQQNGAGTSQRLLFRQGTAIEAMPSQLPTRLSMLAANFVNDGGLQQFNKDKLPTANALREFITLTQGWIGSLDTAIAELDAVSKGRSGAIARDAAALRAALAALRLEIATNPMIQRTLAFANAVHGDAVKSDKTLVRLSASAAATVSMLDAAAG